MNAQATKAYLAARRHAEELGAGTISALHKPSAFHHGLITSLVAALESVDKERQELCEALFEVQDTLRNDSYDVRVPNALSILETALDGQDWDEEGTDE